MKKYLQCEVLVFWVVTSCMIGRIPTFQRIIFTLKMEVAWSSEMMPSYLITCSVTAHKTAT